MGFALDAAVVVRELEDEEWEVLRPIGYAGKYETFEVPVGQHTDFASVPRLFVWFLPRYGGYTLAAILHDYLWRERAARGEMDWADADGLFLRAMRELRVPFLRRWIVWTAVRWAALFKPGGRRGWLKDAWRVVVFTLLAAPVVVPPGLLILVALSAFYLLELVSWVPIEVATSVRTRLKKEAPRKDVIFPKLDLSTTGPPPMVTTEAAPDGARLLRREDEP